MFNGVKFFKSRLSYLRDNKRVNKKNFSFIVFIFYLGTPKIASLVQRIIRISALAFED